MERIAKHDISMVKFCFDALVDNQPVPNLSRWHAKPFTPEWRLFSTQWPYSEPVHFIKYLDRCDIPYEFVEWTQADRYTLYPVSLSYFDFGIDWFELLPGAIKEKLRCKSLLLWFFYSEGDNPYRIHDHIMSQAKHHHIDTDVIRFTSANSAAQNIPGFSYFCDDECLYQMRNQAAPLLYHDQPRQKKFTALVRTHKWWRATTMTRFWRKGLHRDSYFSYNYVKMLDESENDNPIERDLFGHLRNATKHFLANCPFRADALSDQEHNLYSTTVDPHFSDSYFHVVLETHMDVDQSAGVFLTEKTFKPIKNCQPFVIFGAAGSIRLLKHMGYRTFDHVIDHSYDAITNTTERWNAACEEVERLCRQDLHSLLIRCKDELIWNQNLFMEPKITRVNNLLNALGVYEQS
jgi:hypothetical protein